MNSKPSNYQVIARKYRPQTFASVMGQEAIVTTLKNALRHNRLAHAYLFCGCRGTGKTTLARVFAKALNCSRLTDECEPCNACPSCQDIIAGRSLDVLEIDGASNRGIDDIRQINETIGYAPASGKYKIYIIDEVHMLTKEAFNALLKTLEEPPANVKFFFATTEPHKVLPTIISRCQRFDLNRIPFDALKKKLAWIAQDLNIVCEEEVLSLIANLSEGSLRDAESLFDQIICYAEHPITLAKVSATLGIMPRTAFFSLDKAFEEENLSFAFELAGEIFSSGKDLSYFIDNLIEHYRSLLKIKLDSPMTFFTARLKEQYTTAAHLYTEEQCLYILDFLIQWQQQIGKTPFKRVSLEMILLHILRSKHRIALPTLVKRLVELEQQSKSVVPLPEVQTPSQPIETPQMQTPPQPTEAPQMQTPPQPMEALPEMGASPQPIKAKEELPAPPVLSLEEKLLKKIKEKIEAAPAFVDDARIDTSPSDNFTESKTIEPE
ncbi:MAG TPA: DNA polymerase III subunit gamma/tau, partial [Candidatus Paceibacterota bacterium]|nr:DNA polymerase III subunit gamma/tau [Candidatus Paceibacterota bacterium]